MTPDPHPDRALLQALQRGEDSALDRLIERWRRPLHSFAYRYVQNSAEAHDLAAEAFVLLYQRRMRLRSDSNVSAWLFTTLTHLCHNHHRWKRRHPTVALDAAETGSAADIASSEPSPEAVLERQESDTAVRRAIDTLPHALKVALLLHHYEHLSYGQIGTIVGCSERGVESRLYRARERLRALLGPDRRTASEKLQGTRLG